MPTMPSISAPLCAPQRRQHLDATHVIRAPRRSSDCFKPHRVLLLMSCAASSAHVNFPNKHRALKPQTSWQLSKFHEFHPMTRPLPHSLGAAAGTNMLGECAIAILWGAKADHSPQHKLTGAILQAQHRRMSHGMIPHMVVWVGYCALAQSCVGAALILPSDPHFAERSCAIGISADQLGSVIDEEHAPAVRRHHCQAPPFAKGVL